MLTHRLARPLLASMFIAGGVDAFLRPQTKLGAANPIATPLSSALGLSGDPVTLVRLNGALQAGAGIMLAMGMLPRAAATSLGVSLVPTTLAGHRFWEEDDPDTRARQRVQFLKNASMLGGLILAATDTDGRPSVGWRARRALHQAAGAVDRATERATHSLPGSLGSP